MSTALALMNTQTWNTMRDQGTVLVKSGMLPSNIKSPEAAIAIIMKGYELGIPPMQAFAHINVIQGKPTLSSEGMLAQIYRCIPNTFIDFVRVEDEYCEIHAARPGMKARKFIYQKSDAEKAGLINKDNWKKYPRAMYKARCIAEMARTIFPDALMGCSHTPEELQPDVVINEDLAVISVTAEEPRKELPQIELFDIENESQRQKLIAGLSEKKIAGDAIPLIMEELHGKGFSRQNVDEAIRKIMDSEKV